MRSKGDRFAYIPSPIDNQYLFRRILFPRIFQRADIYEIGYLRFIFLPGSVRSELKKA